MTKSQFLWCGSQWNKVFPCQVRITYICILHLNYIYLNNKYVFVCVTDTYDFKRLCFLIQVINLSFIMVFVSQYHLLHRNYLTTQHRFWLNYTANSSPDPSLYFHKPLNYFTKKVTGNFFRGHQSAIAFHNIKNASLNWPNIYFGITDFVFYISQDA